MKQATAKGGKEQLNSYTHATGAPLAVWSDGTQVIVWHRKNPNYFEEIPALPRANETIEMIAGQPWTIDTLLEFEQQREPAYSEEGLPVINARHLRTKNVALDEDNRFATKDAAQLKLDKEDSFTIKQGDLLFNGTGVGTMGRCAPYLRDDKALPDNHGTILRMKPETGLDPIFLSIQLNSLIGQMQVEQYFKGFSGQIELYPSEIKEFRIWLAPQKIQQQIKAHLEQAHAARQEAQSLLERAKRAVEVAIEEGEAAGMALLK